VAAAGIEDWRNEEIWEISNWGSCWAEEGCTWKIYTADLGCCGRFSAKGRWRHNRHRILIERPVMTGYRDARGMLDSQDTTPYLILGNIRNIL
jgi:hypothetical protein